ncbi:fatty acyl-CoA hydrolase precursor, medium chain-like [Hyla sarda]|uniref:fatty acyl-CoA hydrolase precursor, medium chain-like n=1 Tax=Hyla sarda TaxID=327740 RepID=UPI0024C26CA5|nr:fatty acyl-CoA hydrolase precursor, medium chain-like [Hyla sarda]
MDILLHILLFSPLILTTIGTGQNNKGPLVTTKYGQLRGVTVPVKETTRAIDAFFGVPFAKPPVGSLRFAKPELPEPWNSVRDASEYPPICLQEDFMSGLSTYFQTSFKIPQSSEDCLYLNVFTPSDREKKSKLPVLFYIHGGGLLFGLASMYDGSALSAYENVVVVVIQYRVGILGFFSTGDDQLPGNYGMLDQVAALQWVQENIADFGGDPTSVTIVGESAGGFSVSALVISPLSKGLFHRAIAESGAVTMKALMISKSEDLKYYINIVSKISGCEPASIANCLKKKSEEELRTIAKVMGMLPPSATVDGFFLPKPAEEMLANKESNKVPLLIGMNNQEFGWIVPMLLNITTYVTEGITRESVMLKLQELPILGLSPEVIPFAVDTYIGDSNDPMEIRNQFLDLCGDVMFVVPAVKVAKYHRDMGLPVFLYEYQHPSSIMSHGRPDFVKADHGDELSFVFGGPFLRDGEFFAGHVTDEEKILSRTIMRYWANFARTGDPNSPGLTAWPEYGREEHYLQLNLKQKSSSKLKEDKFKFWTEVLPQKLQSQREHGSDHIEL